MAWPVPESIGTRTRQLAACSLLTAIATADTAPRVTLEPIAVDKPVRRQDGMREGQDLSRIGFHLRTPWTSGPIELRFPEVVRSAAGFHFLDHYLAATQPTCEWKSFPRWHKDEATGRIHYDFKTPDGLRLTASATPAADEVALEFRVGNEGKAPLDGVEPNCCLTFGLCPEFNDRANPAVLYAVLDGKLESLAKATPTPAQMGRSPWFLIVRGATAKAGLFPKDSATWWRIDQHFTDNLMAAVARDGKHLVGYTWDREPAALMSNVNNPCLHTGMGASPPIPAGKAFTWHGKIYLLPNDLGLLLERHRVDQAAWRQAAATSPAQP